MAEDIIYMTSCFSGTKRTVRIFDVSVKLRKRLYEFFFLYDQVNYPLFRDACIRGSILLCEEVSPTCLFFSNKFVRAIASVDQRSRMFFKLQDCWT